MILYDALMATASTEAQHEILDAVFERIDPDVYADRRKQANRGTFAGPYRIPYSNRRYDDEKRLIYKWIVDRNRFLMDQLRTTTVSVEIADRDGGLMFVVGVEGHSGASFDTTEIGAPLLGDTTFDGQPDTRFSGTMILYPGLEEESEYVHRRVTNFRIPPHFLKPGKQSYLFGVDRSAIEDLHGRLAGAFSNAVTGDRIEPQILFLERGGGAIAYNEVSLHAWKIPEPPSDDVILGPGKVVLEETLEIGAHQRLIVRAGTELLLGPGVSIASRGSIRMKGTPRKPIQIGRLDPDHAWGSIIAQGTSSSGSRLSYVNATGGSLSSAFNIQYSGMLSFYGSWDVRIEHSSFGDNVDSDDTLHIVYGSYDLEDIRFADCFGDCIDLDLADGTMRGIRVLAAGNDGIDLMTSNSRFRDVVVEGSADKGISVGEASTLTIESLRVSGAQIGVAVKDTSRVYLSEASFADNQTSLSVYADDPVYGGSGELHLRAAKFGVGGVDVQVDDRARLYVYDQPPPPRVLGEGTIERRSGDWPQ